MAQGEGSSNAAVARYAAFISYSHADDEISAWLHRRLESYAVPHSLAGRAKRSRGVVGKRLGRIFRDRAEFGAHHDLATEIRKALDVSDALIVLCSPRAAASPYVEEEIRYFKSLGRGDRIFAAIIAGEPHAASKPGLTAADECFPRALIRSVGADGLLSDALETSEPIAADFRNRKDGRENGSLKLIAGLLDIGLDDLVQREKQAERRRRVRAYAVSGVMGVLALGAAAAGTLAWVNGQTAAARAVDLKLANGALQTTNTQLATTNGKLDAANHDLDTRLRENQALTRRLTSVVREISAIAANDPNVPESVLLLSFGAPLGMSEKSVELYTKYDLTTDKTFRAVVRPGQFCIAFSCIRPDAVDEFREAWNGVLTSKELDLVASVDWKDRQAAPPAELGKIKVTRRQALVEFGQSELPQWVARIRKQFPKTENLPPDCFGALMSISLVSGPGALSNMVGKELEEGRLADIPAAIRARGDRLAGISSMSKARLYEQAAVFEAGLLVGRATTNPAVTVAILPSPTSP